MGTLGGSPPPSSIAPLRSTVVRFPLFGAGYDEQETTLELVGVGIPKRGSPTTCTRRDMGENRWSDIEERKRIETTAKAGDELPEEQQGDASSRQEASKDPAEDEEKRRVVEKLRKREEGP